MVPINSTLVRRHRSRGLLFRQDTKENTMSADADAKNWKDVVEIYEKGKERRYTLLFSVNGGALAIAKLITGAEGHMVVVGGLHLWMLAYAMMVFSLFMAFDIYKFG